MQRTFGWRRPTADPRDHRFLLSSAGHHRTLPSRVDLRPHCPAVYDQLDLGACTANAWAGLDEYLQIKDGRKAFTPSRLLIYWLERQAEGDTARDDGAQLRDGAKALATYGACDEALWPYDPKRFAERPPAEALADSVSHRITRYWAFDNADLGVLKTVLSYDVPFVFGFECFPAIQSDEVAKTGRLPMPGKGETPAGGHAAAAVGYDDALGSFIVRNSWGKDWGLGGYFLMPYAYVTSTDLCADFWTAHHVG